MNSDFEPPIALLANIANHKMEACRVTTHVCFGAALARTEGQIAFNALLRRLSRPALLDTTLDWRDNAGLRGLTRLNISFDPDLATKYLALCFESRFRKRAVPTMQGFRRDHVRRFSDFIEFSRFRAPCPPAPARSAFLYAIGEPQWRHHS